VAPATASQLGRGIVERALPVTALAKAVQARPQELANSCGSGGAIGSIPAGSRQRRLPTKRRSLGPPIARGARSVLAHPAMACFVSSHWRPKLDRSDSSPRSSPELCAKSHRPSLTAGAMASSSSGEGGAETQRSGFLLRFHCFCGVANGRELPPFLGKRRRKPPTIAFHQIMKTLIGCGKTRRSNNPGPQQARWLRLSGWKRGATGCVSDQCSTQQIVGYISAKTCFSTIC
jgi:hypothetical protein